MSARSRRTVRGLVTCAAATMIAMLSHAVAGGSLASPVAIVIALVVSAPLCIALAGRRAALRRQVAGVAVTQVAYHGLFAFFGDGTSATQLVAHGHHGDVQLVTAATGATGHEHVDAWMLLAHLVAGLVTVVILRRGDLAVAALAAVLRSLAHRLGIAVPTIGAVAVRLATPVPAPRRRPVSLIPSVTPRRGPPFFAI